MSWLREKLRFLSSGDETQEQRKLKWITNPKFESLERRVFLSATNEVAGFVALQFGNANVIQVPSPTKVEGILAQEAAAGAGDFRSLAIAPDGSILFSGAPDGLSDGIYRLGTTPGSFDLVSSKPADALAVDGQGDVIAMRFGTNNGKSDPSQVTISSIAPGTDDAETVLYQDTVTGGGTYQAVTADQNGNVYLAGQPGASATDGVYKLSTSGGSPTLVASGHEDRLAIDAEGDILAMRFGQDSYGNVGGAAISQITPAGAETPLYSDTDTAHQYQGLAVDANGNVLFSGQPAPGMANGVYRLNAAAGTLDLLSDQFADEVAVDPQGDIIALRLNDLNVNGGTSTTNASSPQTNLSSPDLSITDGGPVSASPGQQVTYTIIVSDAAVAAGAAGVVVTDVLPAGTSFVSATDSTGATVSKTGGVLTDSIGNLAAGASDTLAVVITAPSPGSITNTATVNSTSPNAGTPLSASATTTISSTPQANLSISAKGPSSASVGQNVTYTITVNNAAGAAGAAGVVVGDDLPSGTTFVSATDSAGAAITHTNDAVTDSIGSLAAGATDTITLVITASNLDAGTTIINSASVATTTSNIGTPTTAVATTAIGSTPQANVSIAQKGPFIASVVQQATYTITLSNAAGAAGAIGVVVTDYLPQSATLVSATDSTGVAITNTNNTLTDDVGNLAAGATDTITVVITMSRSDAGSTIINSADVATTTSNVGTPTIAYVLTLVTTPPLAEIVEIPSPTPIETVLLHDASASAGSQEHIAVAADGSVAVSGDPAPGLGDGIYLRTAGSTQFQLISGKPADALAFDPQDDVLAMRFGHDKNGNVVGATISSIASGTGDVETPVYQDTGGTYEGFVVDQHGNVYLAGQPSATGSVDGIYQVKTPTSANLIKAGHEDQLAVDSQGDILAMSFGHDAYGQNIGGAAISSVAPSSGTATVLYNDPTQGDIYHSLAVTSNGQVLIAGQPGAGTTDGIYRLNPTTGTLDLVSGKHADQIGVDAEGDILAMRFGYTGYGATGVGAAQVAEIAPQAPIESIALPSAASYYQDVAVGPDGRTVISGTPGPGFTPGIYRQGAAPGSYQLISSQTADELAIDAEGDIFAMSFGHDAYGNNAGGAAITEYSAAGGAATVVYSDTSTTDHYQDLAVDQHGNVYIAGQPGATAKDGVYKVTGPSSSSLVQAGHADRLAIDAQGDILAMSFGHDSYGRDTGGAVISDIAPGGSAAPTVIYNDANSGSSDIYNDLAVGANGQVLISGQPGPGTTDGVYALNPATGELDLVLATHVDRLASMTTGVVAEGGYPVTATPGVISNEQTLATFSDPLGPSPVAQYSAQITWGDQTTSAGNVQFDAATGVFSVTGTHTYASAGDFAVTVSITRAGSAETTVTSSAVVAPLASTAETGSDVLGVQGNSLAEFSDLTPLEIVLLRNATDLRAVATGSDGTVAFSGQPAGQTDGVYRLTASGPQLVSNKPADELAVDSHGDIFAMRFGHDAYGHTSGAAISSIAPGTGGGETPVYQDTAGSYQSLAVDQHGNVYFAGQPSASGSVDGIYEVKTSTSATLIKAGHVEQLGTALDGDLLAMQFGQQAYGSSGGGGASIADVAPATGAATTIFNDSSSYEDYAAFTVDKSGQLILSAEGTAPGIYRLNPTSGKLEKLSDVTAEKIAVDAEGDILAMTFGYASYGNSGGGGQQLVEIAPQAPSETVLLSGQTGYTSPLAAAPDGSVVFSGYSSLYGTQGIYRLAANGALQLVSSQPAAEVAVDSQGDIVAMRSSQATATVGPNSILSDDYYAKAGGTDAGWVTAIYSTLFGEVPSTTDVDYWTNLLAGGYTRAEIGTSLVGSEQFYTQAGGTDKAWVDGAFNDLLGRAATASDETHWTAQLALNGGSLYETASQMLTVNVTTVSSIAPGPGDVETVLYQDTGGTYQDMAVDQHGNVYLAGQPNTTGSKDGVYELTKSGSLTLVAPGHADKLAIDAEGDILAMQFGHNAYGHGGGATVSEISAGGSTPTVIYNDPSPSNYYYALAAGPNGQVLISGDPGAGYGIYRLNAATDTLDLLHAGYSDYFAVKANGEILTPNGVDLLEITPQAPLQTVLLPGGASTSGYQDAVMAPDGSVIVSGQPPGATSPGIYRLGTTPGKPTQISSTPADELVLDAEGDIFAMRFAHDSYGSNAGSASITEYNATTSAPTVIYNDTSTADKYEDLAVDQHGNIYLAGQPGASAKDGVYRVASGSTSPTLVASGHEDRLAIDAEGDILAMQFGHDSYGQNIGGATISEINPASGAPSAVYTDTMAGDYYNDLVVNAAGQILLSGQPGPGLDEGVYTLNPATGQLALVNPTYTARIAVAAAPVSAKGGVTLNADLGATTGDQTLATFTDPAGAGALANYSATIDWGDQSQTTPGTITFDSTTNTFTVQGAHTYLALGEFPVTVTIHRTGSPDATVNAVAGVSLPSTGGATVTATEGATVSSSSLGTFSDPITGTYTAIINWGDGQTSSGSVSTSADGTQTVSGSHSYVEAGTETITVSVTDPDGNTASAQDVAVVADVPLAVSTMSVTASAGTLFNGQLATFTDPGSGSALPLGHYSATVNWGDNSSNTTAAITGPDANGVFTISGSHLYASASIPTISVTVHHDITPDVTVTDAATVSGPVTFKSTGGSVTVNDVNGDLQILAGTAVQSSTPLAAVTAVTINGADDVDNSLTIDYSAGTFLVPGGITFNGGALSGTNNNILTIDGGSFNTDIYTFTGTHSGSVQLGTGGQVVNYTNLTPLVNTGTAANAVFKLPDGTVTATLQAGTTSGTLQLVSGNGSFESTTLPAPNGSLTVNSGTGSDTVSVADNVYAAFSGKLTVSGAANILPLHVIPTATLAATAEGTTFTQAVATFSDPNGLGAVTSYSATIDWGDGSSTTPGSLSSPDANGLLTITGSHAYAEAGKTAETVTIVVHRAGATDVTVTDSIGVSEASLTAQGTTITTAPATSFSQSVATFSDANSLANSSDYSATIDWGDQSSLTTVSASQLQATSGGFGVPGSHTYANPGTYTITVTVSDGGLTSTTATSIADVVSPVPFKTVDAVYTIGSGTIDVAAKNGLLANDTAPSQLSVAAGNATGAQGGTFVFNADGSFTYTPPANFPGYDSAQFTVTDASGDKATQTVTVLSQHAGVVWKFYESVLNRTPDPGGLQYWTNYFNGGGQTGQMAVGFFESTELLDKIITNYYENYLLRTPDASGLSYWTGIWQATGGPEQIKAGFADSPEFYTSSGGTPDAWITQLYERILNRSPDPDGKTFWLNYYQQQTAAGVDAGTVRYQIALGFFTAAEAYGQDVSGWFEEYLFRAPSSAEQSQYVSEMEGGANDRTIEEEITNLPEYASNPAQPTDGAGTALTDYYQVSAQSQAAIAAKDALFTRL